MRFPKWTAMTAVAPLAGCATPPQNIKAVKTGESCTPAKMQRLHELSAVQSATATNDALGVFLIGLPMGSMGGGDHKDEIARLKGACDGKVAPVRADGRTAESPPSVVRASQ